MTQIHYFFDWPYDDALEWMHDTWMHVAKHRHEIIIACGSHQEIIVTSGRDRKNQGDFALGDVRPDILFRELDRGGGMTAHEPGQLVLYPVFHLEHRGLEVFTLVKILENAMKHFLHELGISAHRREMSPGVYVGEKKIGFLGLRIKERIVQHGIAVNVMNDATTFNYFDPCGIKNLAITSAKHHTKLNFPLKYYATRLVAHFIQNMHRNASDDLHATNPHC